MDDILRACMKYGFEFHIEYEAAFNHYKFTIKKPSSKQLGATPLYYVHLMSGDEWPIYTEGAKTAFFKVFIREAVAAFERMEND